MATLIKWLIGKISPYLMYILGGILIAVIIVLIGLGNMYKTQVTENVKLQTEVSRLEIDITKLNNTIEIERNDHLILQEKISGNNQKFIDKSRELENFKGREHVLKAKPTLVEKKINNSFEIFMDELSCLTGDKTACSK